MSAFDIQVKKIADTWSTRVPWQSGTDSQLLKEIYDIYQKWGMTSCIAAIEALKHVFAQDVQKAALVEIATAKVVELRKQVKDAEAKAAAVEETKGAPIPGQDITEAMLREKIKETKAILLVEATAQVVSLEAEIGLVRDQTQTQAYQAELKDARLARSVIAREISLGKLGVTQKEVEEAMAALVGTTTINSIFQGLIAKSNTSSSKATATLTTAEAQKTLKTIWCQTIRSVMLQNGQKDMGKVEFEKTESTSKGTLALSSLVHEELANLIVIRIETGENVAEFTSRLQTQERFMRWVISTVLQQAEASQLLQMADRQLFKALKTALPDSMRYLGSDTQGGFTKLCSMVLEDSTNSSQSSSTPKKVAFVSLGGALSRQPGAKITGETRTEEHNKTVVTSYKPKEIEGRGEESSSGEEAEFEKRMIRSSKVIRAQMKKERSPAKGRSSVIRDDQDAPEEAEKASQEQMISLLKEIQSAQAKILEKESRNQECFHFARRGSCIKGNLCKFEHQERSAPSPYPQNPKRSRQESPPPERRQR